jgi:flavin-dependent dehydrogenase
MTDPTLIKIMGAGPAGLSAAITLARHGLPVEMYEQHADVGTRFHNDFQGLENWSMEGDVIDSFRAMSIDIGFTCKPIREGMLYSPSERAHIRSSAPLFYLIKRGNDPDSLDNSLKKQALALGVRFRFNTRANEADCDIIASGPKKPNIFAVGQVFRTDRDDAVIAILDDAVAPKGYAYLLISGGSATLAVICFGPLKEATRRLDGAVAKFRELLDFKIRDPKVFSGFGCFAPPATAVRDGKPLIGEAAGFQDFLFGFGNRYALMSGHLAARSIIEGTDYDALWRKEFGRQLRSSGRNRRIYELFGAISHSVFVKSLRRSGDPKRLLSRCYNGSLLCLPFA